jgi:hypothetical protein
MMRQTERDQARRLILDGYSKSEIADAIARDEADRPGVVVWLDQLAQEIKNERRQLQAAEFRAYHLKQEG